MKKSPARHVSGKMKLMINLTQYLFAFFGQKTVFLLNPETGTNHGWIVQGNHYSILIVDSVSRSIDKRHGQDSGSAFDYPKNIIPGHKVRETGGHQKIQFAHEVIINTRSNIHIF